MKINKKGDEWEIFFFFTVVAPPVVHIEILRPRMGRETTTINANNSREIEFLNKMNLKIFMLPHTVFVLFLLSTRFSSLSKLRRRSRLCFISFLWHTQKFQSVLLFVAFSPLLNSCALDCWLREGEGRELPDQQKEHRLLKRKRVLSGERIRLKHGAWEIINFKTKSRHKRGPRRETALSR